MNAGRAARRPQESRCAQPQAAGARELLAEKQDSCCRRRCFCCSGNDVHSSCSHSLTLFSLASLLFPLHRHLVSSLCIMSMQERSAITQLIKEWNENRLDLFEISEVNQVSSGHILYSCPVLRATNQQVCLLCNRHLVSSLPFHSCLLLSLACFLISSSTHHPHNRTWSFMESCGIIFKMLVRRSPQSAFVCPAQPQQRM